MIIQISPACREVDQLVKLLDAGMNVARLNFSHGDHEVKFFHILTYYLYLFIVSQSNLTKFT